MAAKKKEYELVLTTASPIGEASLFRVGDSYTLFYNQHGFLPRLDEVTLDEAKTKLTASRIMSEGNFDRMVNSNIKVFLEEKSTAHFGEEDEEEFDEIIE